MALNFQISKISKIPKLPKVNRYMLFGAFLVICLLGLQYEFWYGETGRSQFEALKKENTQFEAENDKNLARNQLLEDEVLSLRKNDDVIEGLARENLGLVVKGETYYQFVAPDVNLDSKKK